MKLYSFDIFDTCLVRSCGNPLFVFDLLAERIVGTDNKNDGLRADFALERKSGEELARKALITPQKEDVTIEEIYDYCDFTFATNVDKQEILKAELDIEKEVLKPVHEIKEIINAKRLSGHKICFISDMYLNSGFICSILKECNLMKDGDTLYVSSEYNQTKATGNLYKLVKEKENVEYNNWIHIGDNKYSDFRVPKKLGIHAIHKTQKTTAYECFLSNSELSCGKMYMQLISGICRSCRCELGDTNYHKFASDLIAPLYTSFVFSVFEDAQRRGIDKLYFLARDGYTLYKIAEVIQPLFPNIAIRYIYVSRKSLYLPGLTNQGINIEVVEGLLGRKIVQGRWNVADILDILQMDNFRLEIELSGDIRKDVEKILSRSDFQRELKEKIRTQRLNAINYFKQENFEQGISAIVDLTGTRKCHKSLNDILRSASMPEVFGYYLEVHDNRIKGDNYFSIIYQDRYFLNKRSNLYPSTILEQYFSITTQNRTNSYIEKNGVVYPSFENDVLNTEYKRKVASTNVDVCVMFAKEYLKCMKMANHKEICLQAVRNVNYFLQAPDIDFLMPLKKLQLSWSSINSEYLLKNRLFIINLLGSSYWRCGNLVYCSFIPSMITLFQKMCYARQFFVESDFPSTPLWWKRLGRAIKRKFFRNVSC